MYKRILMFLLLFIAFAADPVFAESPAPPTVILEGEALAFQVDPIIIEGTALVPMRFLFEKLGAEVSWDGTSRTVKATKGDMTFTYQIGEKTAISNGKSMKLPVPGTIVNGTTLIPVRIVGETLGAEVLWHGETRTITITSLTEYETRVISGVNFRNTPNTSGDSHIYRMIPAGETIHVIREIDASWLQVETQDHIVGYVSAKPKYTNFTSESLRKQQVSELIAFGEQYLGTPYDFGASTNQTGTFDCSSFTKHLFAEVLDIKLPRTSYDQAEVGQAVEIEDLQAGDLLFFTARGLPIGHVGIYAGDGKILQTYSKEQGVTYNDFEGQWVERFVSARRLF